MKIINTILFFILISSNVFASQPSITITADIPEVVKEKIINASVTISINDESLYNDQVKLSYHIYDKNNKPVRYENERITFELINGKATVPIRIELPTDDYLKIKFDIIDEKNVFWFGEKYPEKINVQTKIYKPDYLFFIKVKTLFLKVLQQQKILLIFNLLSFFLIVGGVIFYLKRDKGMIISSSEVFLILINKENKLDKKQNLKEKKVFYYRNLEKDCEKSLSAEEELKFLTPSLLNALYEKAKCYQTPFLYGLTAKTLVDMLKKGKSFKNSFSKDIQKDSNGEIIMPLNLLPEHIGNIDSLIITNPYLSLVLMKNENILELIKGNITESIILPIKVEPIPIEIKWINFSITEGFENAYYKWAVGFEEKSLISVINNTNKNIEAKVSFCVQPALFGSKLTIISESSKINLTLDETYNNVEFNVNLKLGVNNINFNFKSEHKFSGIDKRELKFCIGNMSINQISNYDIYNNCTSSLAYYDHNIRKCLHHAGFPYVKGEVIGNDGTSCKPLPQSQLSTLDSIIIQDDLQDSNVTVIYTGIKRA